MSEDRTGHGRAGQGRAVILYYYWIGTRSLALMGHWDAHVPLIVVVVVVVGPVGCPQSNLETSAQAYTIGGNNNSSEFEVGFYSLTRS